MPRYVTLARRDQVPPGRPLACRAEGLEVALFRVGDEYHAIGNECTHQGAPLAFGMVKNHIVACPWHCWQFDVTTGECLTARGRDVPSYRLRLHGDEIQIELPDADESAAESN